MTRLARSLNLSESEFFRRYAVVDSFDGVNLTLVLARKHQVREFAGKYLPCAETYSIESPCVFLGDDNRCGVHDVKPEHCSGYKCWEDEPIPDPGSWSRQAILDLGWDGVTKEPDNYETE